MPSKKHTKKRKNRQEAGKNVWKKTCGGIKSVCVCVGGGGGNDREGFKVAVKVLCVCGFRLCTLHVHTPGNPEGRV